MRNRSSRSVAVLAVAIACNGSPAHWMAAGAVVGGTPAQPGDLPSNLLIETNGPNQRGRCSAVRVGEHAIMTAAHCVSLRGSAYLAEPLKPAFRPGRPLRVSNKVFNDPSDASNDVWIDLTV